MKSKKAFHLPLAAAMLLIAAGCSDVEEPRGAASEAEIMPRATLAASRAALSGAVDGTAFPEATDSVFAVSAFLDGATPYFLNQVVNSDSVGAFAFDPKGGRRFYPEDGSKLYFHAFSPACAHQSATDVKSVSWDMTGREDIMVASDFSGIGLVHAPAVQPQPEFEFRHLLTRLNFRCRRETGFADFIYISHITIKAQHPTATLSLDSGQLTFGGTPADLTYELPTPHQVDVAEGYNEITALTLEPAEAYDVTIGLKSGLNISFPIRATELTWDTDDHNHGSGDIDTSGFKAGRSYNVNLRFQGAEVKMNVSLSTWQNGGTSTGNVITPIY